MLLQAGNQPRGRWQRNSFLENTWDYPPSWSASLEAASIETPYQEQGSWLAPTSSLAYHYTPPSVNNTVPTMVSKLITPSLDLLCSDATAFLGQLCLSHSKVGSFPKRQVETLSHTMSPNQSSEKFNSSESSIRSHLITSPEHT